METINMAVGYVAVPVERYEQLITDNMQMTLKLDALKDYIVTTKWPSEKVIASMLGVERPEVFE